MNEFLLSTPSEVARDVATRLRSLRLHKNWKQATLAERSGVSLASVRRFEQTGEISLMHLLELASALGHLGDFEKIFIAPEARTLKELEAQSRKMPKRGSE